MIERKFDWKGAIRSKRVILNMALSFGLTIAVAINVDLRRDLRQYNSHYLDSLIVRRLTPRVYVFIVTPETKRPVPVDPDSTKVQLETYLDLAPWPWMKRRKVTP